MSSYENPKRLIEEPPFQLDVETFCYFKQGQVTLTLQSEKPQHAQLVSGKPVFCNHEFVCRAKENVKCFLKSSNITTRR